MEIESSNLVDRLIKASDSLWMTKHSWKGGGAVVGGHVTHFNFWNSNHISVVAKA